MGDLQAQLYALEGQLEARQEKTNQFAAGREAHLPQEEGCFSLASSPLAQTGFPLPSALPVLPGATDSNYHALPRLKEYPPDHGPRRLREDSYALRLTRDPFYLERGVHRFRLRAPRQWQLRAPAPSTAHRRGRPRLAR